MKALCQVTGSDEWYNVQYEGEDDIITLNYMKIVYLEDLEVVYSCAC